MFRIFATAAVFAAGLALIGCESTRVSSDNNNPSYSVNDQGDRGSLGNPDGAGGGTSSMDRSDTPGMTAEEDR